jgi:predicted O-methyltransferase YrrM
MDRLTEKYILDHSTPEDPLLEELFRQTHVRFVNPNMVSGHIQGKMLEFLTRMISPLTALEIGTFTGYTAISIARGIGEKGRLITIEINDEMEDFCKSYFARAGVAERIRMITGNALEEIPKLDESFDMVFIDGDKREYCDYFRAVKDKVSPGGFIIADNVLWGGKALDQHTRDQQSLGIIEFNSMIKAEPGIENLILPVRDGIMIIRKN